MSIKINFDNSFSNLPNKFYSKIFPEKTKNPHLIILNKNLCDELNLDYKNLTSSEGVNFLSGNLVLKNSDPLAMVYAGHQFGNWVPQLGDGRALLLGEVLAKNNVRYDIQLKGSGRTPYSRGGDGKAWLGPVIREYLVSEYMNNINIPTTRSLSAILTGDNVYREKTYPGAILCRVARSHIRVGTFQYFYSREDTKSLKILADYFIKNHFPNLEKKENKYFELFKNVVDGQIDLVAKWMKVGFIHGVMNTDNTSISCETIDYGPCAFIDNYKSDKVFSSIDSMGRYSYKNQPNILIWNMACFASTLLPLLEGKKEKNIDILQKEISSIPEKYKNKWLLDFSKKIGLKKIYPENEVLINRFLEILESENLDFTNSFRGLIKEVENSNELMSKTDTFKSWKNDWKKLFKNKSNKEEVCKTITSNNPAFIMRNHLVEQIIQELLIDKKDTLNKALLCIEKPFEKIKNYEKMYVSPTKEQEVLKTFCGT
ncbi:MAG: hypothetical protein CMJ13_02940 [Pelagibacterales bacterium]|nr:hypothetical protein [Pelagibacterales bacterium]